jgi:radical SAM protein (TIGR04043 family)
MDPAILKVELLCLGARLEGDIDKGRKGGAGAAGGRYLILPENIYVNTPLQGDFVLRSPFKLSKTAEGWMLFRDGEPLVGVKLLGTPKFYEKYTSDGLPMWKIALLHGRDCLASTVYQRCYYWQLGKPCKFCAVELSADLGLTIEVKSPNQLAETALEAVREKVVSHVTLTTGTPETPDKGAILLSEAAKAIKERSGLPVHVQLEPPHDLRYLDMLAEAEVDTVGIHIETFDKKALAENCPMKRDSESFFRAWREAVKLFGEAQVSSYIIAGLGETKQSILEGAETLARMGVVPFLVPLRPLVGTPLARSSPPTPSEMLTLYEAVSEILAKYGLDPRKNKAGCVRCGCCSALNEFYKP